MHFLADGAVLPGCRDDIFDCCSEVLSSSDDVSKHTNELPDLAEDVSIPSHSHQCRGCVKQHTFRLNFNMICGQGHICLICHGTVALISVYD